MVLTTRPSISPLEEQNRIVFRIKELTELVREVRPLRQKATEDAERLWQSVLSEIFPRPSTEFYTGWRWIQLEEVAEAIIEQLAPSQIGNSFKLSEESILDCAFLGDL